MPDVFAKNVATSAEEAAKIGRTGDRADAPKLVAMIARETDPFALRESLTALAHLRERDRAAGSR